MNILFVYNLENKDYHEITCKIEEGFNDFIKDTVVNIDRKDKINVKAKVDIYVILSDESQEVDMYFDKIKNKNKVIVLTNNLSSSNILNVVKNTKNVCYMKNDIRILMTKIYNVYLENK
jgi:hypothetical protein